ncbi:hypothetical protein C8R47DRAFT_1189564 [Mycena vitilis]|nr:hypothetical protein C8R47DRAFT_1189564 [Mycena vitilis]
MLPSVALGTVLLAVSGVHAQATFEWGFTNQPVSNALSSCQTLPLTAGSLAGMNGVPPYYMIALPVHGAPITSFIGANESNLSWQVQYPTGTQLLLEVVDSQGSTGGVDTPMYTVSADDSVECIPPTTPDFNITANVTDFLTPCQPWGLKIEGGTPPYSVTIAVQNTGFVTNVTLGSTDTVFTYINSAPAGSMIASASDKNGRWATGSILVTSATNKSSNACTGLASTSGNGTSPPSQGATGSTSSALSHSAKLGAIIGGSVAGVLLLVALGLWAIWWRKRRAERDDTPLDRPNMAFEASPFNQWRTSAAPMSTASSARVSTALSSAPTSSGPGQMLQMLHPDANWNPEARWSGSATSQSFANSNSTGVPTPTSAAPLVLEPYSHEPPPYASNSVRVTAPK